MLLEGNTIDKIDPSEDISTTAKYDNILDIITPTHNDNKQWRSFSPDNLTYLNTQ